MASIVTFTLTDISRLAYMRSLDLGANVFEPRHGVEGHELETSFAYLLAHPSTALDTLILPDAAKILEGSPQIAKAIHALPSLKRQHAHRVGRAAVVAVRTMRSQLVLATVALVVPLGYTPALRGHSAFSDVFSALQFSTDTPRELDLSLGTPVNPGARRSRLSPVPSRAHTPDRPRHAFPPVHPHSPLPRPSKPSVHPLRLFPNLQNLHIAPGLDSFRISEDPNVVWFIYTLRNANGKVRLSPSLKLVECSGEVTSLYPLSTYLTASTLRMCGHLGEHELPFFRTVVAESRPAELEASMYSLKVVEEVIRILGQLEVGTCRVLTLHVSSRPGDGDGVVTEERLRAALSTLLPPSSSLEVIVNVPSRGSVVLPADGGVSAEDAVLDCRSVSASSWNVFGAIPTDTWRLDWRIVRQGA